MNKMLTSDRNCTDLYQIHQSIVHGARKNMTIEGVMVIGAKDADSVTFLIDGASV